jgi:hypothetical protein
LRGLVPSRRQGLLQGILAAERTGIARARKG